MNPLLIIALVVDSQHREPLLAEQHLQYLRWREVVQLVTLNLAHFALSLHSQQLASLLLYHIYLVQVFQQTASVRLGILVMRRYVEILSDTVW